MEIIEATLHQIKKTANTHGEGSVDYHKRQSVLPVDSTLEGVCRDLLKLYNNSSDNSGTFGSNPTVHVFPVKFQQYLDEQLGFLPLTHATVDLIGAQMETVGARLATGGFALFLRYREPPNEFLLVAMLKLKAGAGISDDLGFLATLNIDLDLLNEAARINISRYQQGEEPYLTFIKGSKKAAKVTEYFRNALACQNYTNGAEQTKQLIAAADDFVMQRDDLDDEEARQIARLDMRKRLYDCLLLNRSEVTLSTAAAAVHPGEPEEFVTFARQMVDGERKYAFDGRFKPDRKVTQVLRRISGSMGSVRVSFDVDDVRKGLVSYDAERDVLIIRQPSERLKEDISAHVDPAAH